MNRTIRLGLACVSLTILAGCSSTGVSTAKMYTGDVRSMDEIGVVLVRNPIKLLTVDGREVPGDPPRLGEQVEVLPGEHELKVYGIHSEVSGFDGEGSTVHGPVRLVQIDVKPGRRYEIVLRSGTLKVVDIGPTAN